MGTKIHASAVVDPKAELADGVEVGPFTVIGPHVKIGRGSVIYNHVTLAGWTTIGAECQIFPGAVVGTPPQDLKYQGEKTTLEVGDQTIIREFATLNPGTALGGGQTKVGAHNLLMAYVHIAHDCRVGDHVIIANSAQLAGHVHVDDGARISGLVAIHHFCHIGRCAFVAGSARLSIDVPPYTLAEGHPARMFGVNVEALKRRGVQPEAIDALKEAFRLLFKKEGPRTEAYEKISALGLDKIPVVEEFVEFAKTTDRGRHGRGLEAQRATVPPEERDGTKTFRLNDDEE